MEIGEKLKARRKELELTLQEVAEYVGVTKPTVLRWERGIINNMKRDKIQKLAEILKVSTSYILGLTENIEDVIVARRKAEIFTKINNMPLTDLDKLNSMIDLMFKK